FFQNWAESLEKCLVPLGITRGEGFELRQNPARNRILDLREDWVLLQHLARDIERQILAIDYAADEAEISRQQPRIVSDEDSTNIKLYASFPVRVEKIVRPQLGHEEQHGIGLAPFGLVVNGQRRLVDGICQRAKSLRVLLGLNLALRPMPQCAGGVDLLRSLTRQLQLDWEQDVVRIGADDPLDLVALEEDARIRFERQLHGCAPGGQATGCRLRRSNGEP